MNKNKEKLLELMEKNGESLHRLLYRLTLCEEDAQDLMQELFLKLYCSRQTANVKSLYFYARSAAINLAFDQLRRRKRISSTDEISNEPVSNGNSPLTELVKREEQKRMLAAVSKLKNPYRDIIVLRYIEQESYESIAELNGKTAHGIRAICSRGISKLREMLENERLFSEERNEKDVEIERRANREPA